jgi:uncharacterized protein YkwD
MTSYRRQIIALALVSVAMAIYIGIGMIQAGGIRTYWGRLPPTGGRPLIVVTEPLANMLDDSSSGPAVPAAPSSTLPPAPSPVPVNRPLAGPSGVVLTAMNARRTEEGLASLQVHGQLTAAAQAHADDMASRGYFDHTTPDGRTFGARMASAGISATGLAENLGLTTSTAISTVVASWMQSSTHRQNLLGSFSAVGIGVASGTWQGQAATYVVAIFSTAP